MKLERDIEQYLVRKVKTALQGIPYKFTSPARRSVPDRLLVLPESMAVFVECKAPGKKPTPAQEREHQKLEALGHKVWVVDTYESVDELVEIIKAARSVA